MALSEAQAFMPQAHRAGLLLAFALAVMADPVSSVAYAIEAALRALQGDLALLVPTMALVVAIVAVVIANYHQLVARYPGGGGAAAATGEAFGEASAFVPIGALIVDFVLTIAISSAAGASAVIAFVPVLAPWRVLIAVALVAVVAGGTWFGHLGRSVFAVLTVAFVALAVTVLIYGLFAAPQVGAPNAAPDPGHPAPLAVALAFPVAMALATGVEAPSSAIAQLGQLDDARRRRFGRVTLWLTLAVVGSLTLGLSAEAVHLDVGIPPADSTQIAEIARAAASPAAFSAFQLATALLLLSAASSSFQAGPGLFKALARDTSGSESTGILPRWLGTTNRRYTPYWSVLVFAVAAAAVATAAGGQDQELVLFYAASVFLSFVAGLLAMTRFSWRERRRGFLVLNVIGTVAVGFTLAVNLTRGEPIASIGVALAIAGTLYGLWVKAGRPRGIRNVAAKSGS